MRQNTGPRLSIRIPRRWMSIFAGLFPIISVLVTLCSVIPKRSRDSPRTESERVAKYPFAVPAESFLYHISRNHVSRWLYSRAMFPVAEFLRPITWHSLQDVDAHRKIIFEAIVKYRKMKTRSGSRIQARPFRPLFKLCPYRRRFVGRKRARTGVY